MLTIEFAEEFNGEGVRDYTAAHLTDAATAADEVFVQHGLVTPDTRLHIDFLEDDDCPTIGSYSFELGVIHIFLAQSQVEQQCLDLVQSTDTLAHERAHILRAALFAPADALIELVADEAIAHHIGIDARWHVGKEGDYTTEIFSTAINDNSAYSKIDKLIDKYQKEGVSADKIVHDLLIPRITEDDGMMFSLAVHLGIYEVAQRRKHGARIKDLIQQEPRKIVDTWLF